MILADYFECRKSLQWDLSRQAGIRHAVIRLPEDPEFDVTSESHWEKIGERFSSFGLTPVAVEPIPNRIYESIKCGGRDRDANIEKVIRMMKRMDERNIRLICANFMAHLGWLRTSSDFPERGGALVTAFDMEQFVPPDDFRIESETLWENLRYFLEAVVPYAEQYGIRLALHPDDPPVTKLGGVCRILTSRENMERAVHLVESPQVGITLCQGTFAAMGEDICRVIDDFSRQDKLFFVHFRDISGNRHRFHETFHDNGRTDMARVVRAYQTAGFHGPVRVDHVPTMAGEKNDRPGYSSIGRLYAIGYLKGLLDASGDAG